MSEKYIEFPCPGLIIYGGSNLQINEKKSYLISQSGNFADGLISCASATRIINM